MPNFADLPDEAILHMMSVGKLTPREMIRLTHTCRLFNRLMRDNELWRPYLPESIRYQSNLYLKYAAFMQSDQITRLAKFLIHNKGMTYENAICVRIRDNRIVQKITNEEMTLDEGIKAMTLAVMLRNDYLNNKITLEQALTGNIPHIERFYIECNFYTDIPRYNNMLKRLLDFPNGIQMLLEGLIDPSEYNNPVTSGMVHLTQDLAVNPYTLIALREGLVSGTQIYQLIKSLDAKVSSVNASDIFQAMFSEESLQAMRMGYINLQHAKQCCLSVKGLKGFRHDINTIARNYFEETMKQNPLFKTWLKEHSEYVVYARTLFNHYNGWQLYSKKILSLDHLLLIPSLEYLVCLITSETVVEALLVKKITLDQLLTLKSLIKLQKLCLSSDNFWLNNIINGTITFSMLESLSCDSYILDNFRWTFIRALELMGKSMTDLLKDTNCEIDHLVSIDNSQLIPELERIIHASDKRRVHMDEYRINRENDKKLDPELCSLMYGYYVQAIKNLIQEMKICQKIA